MAKKEFNPICEGDTAELRKQLNLPVTKELRYMRKNDKYVYEPVPVVAYTIFSDNGGAYNTLQITTVDGKTIKIHEAFFAHMQKPSFTDDMENYTE